MLSIVALDEALTLLCFGVQEDDRPSAAVLENARASIGNYLETLGSSFVHVADDTPQPPELEILREADVPTVSEDAFARSLEGSADRRRRLGGSSRPTPVTGRRTTNTERIHLRIRDCPERSTKVSPSVRGTFTARSPTHERRREPSRTGISTRHSTYFTTRAIPASR